MKKCLAIIIVAILLCGMLPITLAESSYKLLLDFEFNSSTLFGKKYNVAIYLNKQEIAHLEHGQDFKKTLDVEEGINTIYIYKSTDKSIKGTIQLDISGNTKVTCWFRTQSDKVDINDIKIQALPDNYTGTSQTTPEELKIEDGEIAFRSIPWGSDYYVAAKAFESKNYSGGLNTRPNMYMINGLNDLVSWFPKIETKWGRLGECAIVYSPEMQVAGYDLNEINLYYAYTPDAFGDITRDLKNTALFAAVYDIKVPGEDYDKTITDLKSKLSKNYGSDITQHEDKYTDKKATYFIWKGKNDTYVCLCDISEQRIFTWGRRITIVYASKKFENKLTETDAILSAIDKANSTPAPYEVDNNDGL